MPRSTTTRTVTSVRRTCEPFGRARENPPSLADLRQFVAEADGLPGDLPVHIDKGDLDSSGRRRVTFSVRYDHPQES